MIDKVDVETIVIDEPLREALSDEIHEIWIVWMQWLFQHSTPRDDGVLIPMARVEYWQRQMRTPYAALSEPEKDEDRDQVDRLMRILRAHRLTPR